MGPFRLKEKSSLRCQYSFLDPFLPCNDGRYESHESWKEGTSHDSDCRIQVCGRIDRLEDLGSERGGGGDVGSCGRSDEEDWLIQDRRHAQSEAEIKACDTSTEGREPIHERAVRLQSQACIQDSEGTSDEEAQGARELSMYSA